MEESPVDGIEIKEGKRHKEEMCETECYGD